MVKLGYALSSEEHAPNDLVRYAQRAEEVGFSFALISDHYHPWIDQQGHSPFVWSVLGGIAQVTSTLVVGTGVTCPIIRIHPAIIAQAAATVANMMPGRFFLGVGTGENLNEHILGDRWPAFDVRANMLEEAVQIIRMLWRGEQHSHYGEYYTVENARIYTLPEELPEIMVAAAGPKSAKLASRVGDGLISTGPDTKLVEAFAGNARGQVRPKYGQITVCWNEDEAAARKIAHQQWPNAALKGGLGSELPVPKNFEDAAGMVTEEDVAQAIICGNDAQRYIKAIQEYIDAGFDHVYIHQVGPDQEGFFTFFQQALLPAFETQMAEAR